MKKYLLLFLTIGFGAAMACDLCNYYLTLMPHDYRNTFGLRYRYSLYETPSSHHHEITKILHSTAAPDESYQSYELWGQIYLHPSLEFDVLIPFKFNGAGSERFRGMGDALLLAQYEILRRTPEGANGFQQRVTLGGGVKFPTGRFDRAEDPHLQTGTESTDLLVTGSHTMKWRSWGLSSQASYSFNRSNRHDFRFANRLNVNSIVFHRLAAGTTVLLPQAGLCLEQAGNDRQNGSAVENTGGTMLLWQAGVQTYWKNVALQVQAARPFSQSAGLPKNRIRLTTGLSYSFNAPVE